ncbi:MAG: pyruvate kinase [Nanoarchaeota archaeon]|nr:pyruvate kinase [Nanoarchaeota archaeon]
MKKTINAIVTMPPYAPFIDEVIEHPLVKGIRLNIVMPIKKDKREELLKGLYEKTKNKNKELWLDLKCRQLRTENYGVPPFTEIELSHKIQVYTPCKAYFSDRSISATILEVDGNKLIMQEGPKRVIGPGESVTIPHPTLQIEGYLTDKDKEYIETGNKIGLKNYMLSFVEKKEDIEELKKYCKDATIISKIESQKGIDNLKEINTRLMAARGDLYMELNWPHEIIFAVEKILAKDENAMVASRIFSSLEERLEPSCEDLGDVDNLLRMGYKTFMFGDDICFKKDSIIGALNLLSIMARRYVG